MPHCRHVVSDHHTFKRTALSRVSMGDETTGWVVNPAAWFTAQMLQRAEDHFERMAESIEAVLAVGGRVIVKPGNLAKTDEGGGHEVDVLGFDEGPPMKLVGLEDVGGVFDVGLIRRTFGRVMGGTGG